MPSMLLADRVDRRASVPSWRRGRGDGRARRRWRCARGSCCWRPRAQQHRDRRAARDRARTRCEVAQSLCRASAGRVDGRAAAGAAAQDHRRPGRGGDRQDTGNDPARRDALVDAFDGRRGRSQPDGGAPDLEGVRAPAASPGRVEALADPQFIEKVRDVVGLYLNPPERAVVLCVDEKSQIQALDRTAPILPMLPGVPERATHDYKRAGTSSLYAALDITSGKVIGRLHSRHRAIEFKQFLQTLDREVPAELDVHVVLDNSRTHKTPAIQKMAARAPPLRLALHPDQQLVAEPRRALVRRTDDQETAARRASLRARTQRRHPRLDRDLERRPKPYVWTKTADQILESIARYCTRINDSRH